MVLTVVFEFALGRYVVGQALPRLQPPGRQSLGPSGSGWCPTSSTGSRADGGSPLFVVVQGCGIRKVALLVAPTSPRVR
jgi:hypothetical protein